MQLPYLLLAALFGLLAVLFGAFGAHGLEHRLDAAMLARFQTGVEYQFYHVFALLITAVLMLPPFHTTPLFPRRALVIAAWAFITGIILFSGSLYIYALSGIKQFGMITPVGGLAFIIGWASLMRAGWALSKQA